MVEGPKNRILHNLKPGKMVKEPENRIYHNLEPGKMVKGPGKHNNKILTKGRWFNDQKTEYRNLQVKVVEIKIIMNNEYMLLLSMSSLTSSIHSFCQIMGNGASR